jgi:hypothetical protein
MTLSPAIRPSVLHQILGSVSINAHPAQLTDHPIELRGVDGAEISVFALIVMLSALR